MRKQIGEPSAAVLDVGSFSARLVVLAKGGSPLDPVLSHQTRLRLDRELDDDGNLTRRGIDAVSSAVEAGMTMAAKHGVEDVYPLATSSIRDAANVKQVVCDVAKATGVKLRFLTGRREAELAYVGARRWYGASAGGLLVLDIGGGTVELAAGEAEEAGFAHSLPLGARSLTRDWFATECPSPKVVRAMREHVLDEVRDAMQEVLPQIRDHRAVGCSKVLRQLARLAGDRPSRSRELHLDDLRAWIPRLAKLPAKRRAELPGISRQRSHQALAGAIVAEALLTLSGGQVAICPWSTRDGLLLGMLDGLVTLDGKPAKAA
ncbi:Ppx/GppA phosphatase family protein [Amycolatopsis azurea]|uniref:Exopolyphosphatase n=1 Tax=Amycolatopsis azurea DSM 43854 TaxID=1238180 RepID=M2PSW0_9PSEU|nr:exopolyphosphatase [Amycolatopsis azurea]EMD27678.1 Exopolyphosphatase [Amycolatopsis azurea DSM 43854]OOC03076.1 exopolyphosphatase [Amycolatopsis azurea DSM 43854]